MRLTALAFTAILVAAAGWAQPSQSSAQTDLPTRQQDTSRPDNPATSSPVSIDKIKEALAKTPPITQLRGLNETPHFKIEITERQKFSLDDLIKSLDFKTGPAPGGGLYGWEQQRQMFNPVDNPLRQPYAAFNQGELLTILTENLARQYLGGRLVNAVSAAERAHAEAAARTEVQQAVREYCSAQPLGGAGIIICSNPVQ